MAPEVWGYVHILLLVFWVGTDVGVFLCANVARTTKYSLETRNALFTVLGDIDLLPRFCFALIFPSGLTLIDAVGLYLVPLWALLAAWAVGGAWVIAIWRAHVNGKAGWVGAFRAVQYWGQGLFGGALVSAGIASLMSGEPVAEKWLAAKILLLGAVCFIAMLMTAVSRPFDAAYTEINVSGSTPALEATASKSMGQTLAVVLVLYVTLLVTAFLGTVKPF
ncbi:MAG: hypothetical protein JNK21_01975 [Rhodospirillaceae bacterium]|nr:hypothetical protein [Rhodospirillaceae bacterium]